MDLWLQRASEVAAFAFPIIAVLWAGAIYLARKFARLAARVESLALSLTQVQEQLKNNGGKSLRDVADRTEKAVADLRTETAGAVQALADRTEKGLAVLADRVDDVQVHLGQRIDTVSSDLARFGGRFDEHVAHHKPVGS